MSNKNKNDFFSHNINNSYEEEFDEFDNELNNKNHILSKLIPSKENKEYNVTVYRGFVWIFMVLTSFLAVFLIFKIPYYEYYNQTTPIVVGDGGRITKSPDQTYDDFSTLGSLDKYLDNGDKSTVQLNKNSNVAINNNVKNKNESANNTKDLKTNSNTDFLPSVTNQNKKSTTPNNLEVDDQDLGSLLLKDTSKSNNSSVNSKVTNNSKVDISREETQDSNSDITKILQDTIATGKKEESGNKTARDLKLPSNAYGNAEVEVIKKESFKAIDIRVVWVVNIFSTVNQAILQEKLSQIINNKENIFSNSTFYFTEYILNGRKNYRISVVGTKQAIGGVIAYSKQDEALSFCKVLRENSVDCFVSSINSNLLVPVKK